MVKLMTSNPQNCYSSPCPWPHVAPFSVPSSPPTTLPSASYSMTVHSPSSYSPPAPCTPRSPPPIGSPPLHARRLPHRMAPHSPRPLHPHIHPRTLMPSIHTPRPHRNIHLHPPAYYSGALFASGSLDRTNIVLLMTLYAAAAFYALDRMWSGFLMSLATANGGPAIEVGLISTLEGLALGFGARVPLCGWGGRRGSFRCVLFRFIFLGGASEWKSGAVFVERGGWWRW